MVDSHPSGLLISGPVCGDDDQEIRNQHHHAVQYSSPVLGSWKIDGRINQFGLGGIGELGLEQFWSL